MLGRCKARIAILLRVSGSHVLLSGMSYLDGLPAYVYTLRCGHTFRTLCRSVPDEETGVHWFYCAGCRSFVFLSEAEIFESETPPVHPSGMRMSDNQLTVRINAAVIKDRVAALYRVFWDAVGIREAAEMLDVSERHVKAVALDLGVYETE